MRTNRNDIWVHPNAIIRLFDKSVKLLGNKPLLKNRKYAPLREAWIASVFLLGIRELSKKTWWLRVNPEENDVGDLFAWSYVEMSQNQTDAQTLSIQVFTHRKTDSGNVYDGIKRKLNNRDLKGCKLVCYLMKDELIKWDYINNQIKSLSPKLGEIWIIGNIGNRRMGVFNIFPNKQNTSINLDNNYQTIDEKTFIFPFRGLRKGKIFERLGSMVHLKPDFTFEDI
jgi:hypothetical protein